MLISQWITLFQPVEPRACTLVLFLFYFFDALYSFCAGLLHTLIMWLTVIMIIIIIIIIVFDWHVSRTLLSIIVNFSSAVVWMVSVLPLISNSSSLFFQVLVNYSKSPTTNDITVTFTFQSFFQFSSKVQVFEQIFVILHFHSADTAKSVIWKVLFFLLIKIRSGLLAGIWWSVWNSKSKIILCLSIIIIIISSSSSSISSWLFI